LYTLGHYGLGLLYGTTRAPFYWPLLASLIFEHAENYIKKRNPEIFPVSTPDSWINSTLDTVAVMAGWATTKYGIRYYRRRRAKRLQPAP
jgi:hypothetical protein